MVLLNQADIVLDKGFALGGVAGVVVIAQRADVHIHDVLADDGPQAHLVHRLCHREHIVIDLVDGGDARLHALPGAQAREMVDVLRRQLALHGQGKAVEAVGVVLQQAFEQAARHMGVGVHDAGQHGLAVRVHHRDPGAVTGIIPLAHGGDPAALHQQIALAVDGVLVIHCDDQAVFKQCLIQKSTS